MAQKLVRLNIDDIARLISREYESEVIEISVATNIDSGPNGVNIDFIGVEAVIEEAQLPRMFTEMEEESDKHVRDDDRCGDTSP